MSTGLKALEDIGHTRLFCVRLYWQQRLRRQKYLLWTQIRRGATLRLPSVKCQKARFGLEKDYSSSPGDRNRLTGGSQSISKCAREIGRTVSQFLNVHGQVSQFLNVRLPRSGRMPMKSGRVPIYKAARVCSAPTHMGVCCVGIGDEMVPLKRERERKTLVTVAVYPLAYTRDHLYHLKR